MKRIICTFICAILIVGLAACSGSVPESGIASRDDVPGSVIGVLSDTAAAAYAESRGDVHKFATREQLVSALKTGLVDCAIVDDSIAKRFVRGQFRLELLEDPLISASFCFAIAKENADLTEAVNGALRQLEDAEVLKDIINGYFHGGKYVYKSPSDIDRSKGTLTLAVGKDFPPYKVTSSDGEITGLDIDVARAVCDLLGLDLDISVITNESLISAVMHGSAHFALGGLYYSETGSELVDFSIPYATCIQRIVVRK